MNKKLLVSVALLVTLLLCAAVAFAKEVPDGAVVAYGELEEITSVGGHAVGAWTVVLEPTCEEKGRARFDCATPGVHADTTTYHEVYIAALGHDWSSETGDPDWGKVVVAPTCTSEGKAIDICLRCGKENPDVYRIIEKTPHVYNMKKYTVAKDPTCVEVGYGIRVCVNCGFKNPVDVDSFNKTKTTEVVIPMIDHAWSDWRIDKASTCDAYGEAHRACTACGAQQILDKDHTEVLDHGKTISIDEVIPMLNTKWADAKALLEAADYDDEAKLKTDLAKAAKMVDFVQTKNWLADCYTREITLSCPYCKGAVHENIVYTMVAPLTIAHKWVLQEAVASDTVLTPEQIKDDKFLNNDKSLPATCTLPGFELYLCENDADHSHNMSTVYTPDPAYLKKYLNPLGHKFGNWEVVEKYTKDGVNYVNMIRECSVCHATENQVIKEENAPEDAFKKNGLVKDEDGIWRNYVNNVLDTSTKIVPFEGGEFWVVNGVLASDASGLTICPDGKAYFLCHGQIQRVSQFAEYKGEWFIIVNGMLDEKANGLYEYDGGLFVFAAGKLRKDVNGLWQNPKDGKWYFLANGQVQKVSQVASYNGEFFVIKDGVLDTDYNGTIEFDGKTFNVVKGQLYADAE